MADKCGINKKKYLHDLKRKGSRINHEVMSLINISAEHANLFYISDEDYDNNLIQVHYADNIKNTWEKSVKVSNDANEWEKYPTYFPRGFVIDMDKHRLVCRSFEYTPEIVQSPKIFKGFVENFMIGQEPWDLFEMKEGTIIRAFNHNGVLRFSTHRRLSCENSKWGSQLTFLEMLYEAALNIGFNLDKLKSHEKEFQQCHVLLLVHRQNQCINQKLVEPMIYHLNSWQTTEITKDGSLALMKYVNVDLGLPRPKKLTVDDACEFFISGNGIIATQHENCFKLIPESLYNQIHIRGFDYNIKHRWYELCDTNQQHLLKDVVPLHLKKQIEGFHSEKDILINHLAMFLSNIFSHELMKIDHGIYHSKIPRSLLDTIWNKFILDKRIYYNMGGTGKVFWDKTPKDTQSKIFDEFYQLISGLNGVTLYAAITKYQKHLKIENKKRNTIKLKSKYEQMVFK